MNETSEYSKAIAHYRSGMELMEKGHFVEASKEFIESVQIDPDFFDAHFGTARVYRAMGQYQDCIPHLEVCLNSLPTDVEVVQESAEIYFLAGVIDKATPLYESLHALNPEDDEVTSLCLAITLVHETPKKALKKARRYLEENPNWVAGYLYLGNIHEMEGHLAEAEEAYQRALDLVPDHHGARENIKRLREGKPLEISPLSLAYDEIFLTECRKLKNQGFLNRAAELMEYWRERYPDHPMYCEMLVDLYRQQGQVQLGLSLINEVSSNKNNRLRRLEGILQLDSGNPEKALEILAPLREEFVDDPLFLGKYAEALSTTGQDAEALQPLEEGVAVDPENASLWFLRAKVCKRLGDLSECRRSLERTIEADPKHSEGNFALGIEHLRENRNREAVAPLRALVAASPDHSEGWRHLAVALTRLKDYPAALETWGQVLRLVPGDSQASGNLAKLRHIVQQSSIPPR